ncbi:MAG: general stress protein CsbD [Bacteroidetes bacterium GWF2_42_66]|nr:MAG: general stress protein CsbD [Bacteroidetes bacterium GWA2_42_15]OFX97513.1 MAG: general stress protein CsbD [Bacteroidetes bacterium GWE2_42_39]OFY43793.1 MAG: general stress protein CsbD [Bacteroidetes bacterium GWF2_42_66]HBL76227.1 general stress protein CsbD [Prolixibacteraceae bacterium]HCR89281.1 general stress protein CsbD [Prolixibacteraceae bacterium]
MNATNGTGNWDITKGKLKQKFAVLTENDLMYTDGRKEEMIGRLQIKLGKTKEELQRIIESLQSSKRKILLPKS